MYVWCREQEDVLFTSIVKRLAASLWVFRTNIFIIVMLGGPGYFVYVFNVLVFF